MDPNTAATTTAEDEAAWLAEEARWIVNEDLLHVAICSAVGMPVRECEGYWFDQVPEELRVPGKVSPGAAEVLARVLAATPELDLSKSAPEVTCYAGGVVDVRLDLKIASTRIPVGLRGIYDPGSNTLLSLAPMPGSPAFWDEEVRYQVVRGSWISVLAPAAEEPRVRKLITRAAGLRAALAATGFPTRRAFTIALSGEETFKTSTDGRADAFAHMLSGTVFAPLTLLDQLDAAGGRVTASPRLFRRGPDDLLVHELAHLPATSRSFYGRNPDHPDWLEEGAATYFAQLVTDPDAAALPPVTRRQRRFELSELASVPYGAHWRDVWLLYWKGSHLVWALVATHGVGTVAELLAASRAEGFTAALESVLGLTDTQFEAWARAVFGLDVDADSVVMPVPHRCNPQTGRLELIQR